MPGRGSYGGLVSAMPRLAEEAAGLADGSAWPDLCSRPGASITHGLCPRSAGISRTDLMARLRGTWLSPLLHLEIEIPAVRGEAEYVALRLGPVLRRAETCILDRMELQLVFLERHAVVAGD